MLADPSHVFRLTQKSDNLNSSNKRPPLRPKSFVTTVISW